MTWAEQVLERLDVAFLGEYGIAVLRRHLSDPLGYLFVRHLLVHRFQYKSSLW